MRVIDLGTAALFRYRCLRCAKSSTATLADVELDIGALRVTLCRSCLDVFLREVEEVKGKLPPKEPAT